MSEVYRTGFIGATVPDATRWISQISEGARTILVPFAGTGRDIAAMARDDTTIYSWDTQAYSRMVINGVFAAKTAETNIDNIRYRKGWMYENRGLKYIDERSAGFIDWVCTEGTDFDKACLASAIVRCTLFGRMTQWYANIEQLYNRFEKARIYNAEWINRPGQFCHTEGSFFDSDFSNTKDPYDLVQVDPPKMVVGSDVYSTYFQALQLALTQARPGEEQTREDIRKLPKWNWRDVSGYFRQIMKIPSKKVLFMYVSKVRPDYSEVKRILLEFGTIEEEKSFSHNGRTDYGLVLRKE